MSPETLERVIYYCPLLRTIFRHIYMNVDQQ